MTTIIATKAASAATNIAAMASSCKSAAIVAGHKISIAATTYILPAVKLAWVKFAAAATPAAHFLASPIGLALVGVAAGAVTTTIGVSLIITAKSDKLQGDVNSLTRRIILFSGITLGVMGIAITAAGAIGGAVVLLA